MTDRTKTFYFRAVPPEGGIISGQLDGSTTAEVANTLIAKGYRPLRVETAPIRDSLLKREIGLGSAKRISMGDAEMFCRELHILVASGVELSDALAVMISSFPARSRLQRFTASIRQGLRFGRSFSDAVEQAGFQIPSDFLAVLRAGEAAGSLARPLAMLSDSYREMGDFTKAFLGALVYPAFLVGVAVLSLGIIAFFVAPNLAGLFVSMEKPAPMAIGAMSALSSFLGRHFVLIIACTVVSGLLVLIAARRRDVREAARRLWFRTPIIGPILVWGATQKFAATLQLYVQSNVPMAIALPGAYAASGFPDVAVRTREISQSIRRGGKIAATIEAVPLIPHKVPQLLRVGESSGRLADVLAAIAAEAKNRFQGRMALISNLLAPMLILFVGAIIGAIIFSVFSALLEVNNLAS